jgi:hypothetical protein
VASECQQATGSVVSGRNQSFRGVAVSAVTFTDIVGIAAGANVGGDAGVGGLLVATVGSRSPRNRRDAQINPGDDPAEIGQNVRVFASDNTNIPTVAGVLAADAVGVGAALGPSFSCRAWRPRSTARASTPSIWTCWPNPTRRS